MLDQGERLGVKQGVYTSLSQWSPISARSLRWSGRPWFTNRHDRAKLRVPPPPPTPHPPAPLPPAIALSCPQLAAGLGQRITRSGVRLAADLIANIAPPLIRPCSPCCCDRRALRQRPFLRRLPAICWLVQAGDQAVQGHDIAVRRWRGPQRLLGRRPSSHYGSLGIGRRSAGDGVPLRLLHSAAAAR